MNSLAPDAAARRRRDLTRPILISGPKKSVAQRVCVLRARLGGRDCPVGIAAPRIPSRSELARLPARFGTEDPFILYSSSQGLSS